jgi:hypothetical protein
LSIGHSSIKIFNTFLEVPSIINENIRNSLFHSKFWREIIGGTFLAGMFSAGNFRREIILAGNFWLQIFGGKIIWRENFGRNFFGGNFWREAPFSGLQ